MFNLKYDYLTKETLQKDYDQLKSFKLIAEKYNVWPSIIKNYCKKFGIKTIPKIKYTCDENIFATDTEESFYLAGFIAADGCILENKNKIPTYLSIILSAKDLTHLQLIKSLLNFTGPIKNSIKKSKNLNCKNYNMSSLSIYSKQIINDLKRFEIGPRKSLTYSFPQWLITHPLVHHFMRGYFDGDGSFYHDKFSKRTFFSIRGTINFLNDFKNILKIKSISLPKINNGQGQLAFKGQKDVANIVNFLYKDATIFLQRKKLLVEKFL